jgi:hypothetical protein
LLRRRSALKDRTIAEVAHVLGFGLFGYAVSSSGVVVVSVGFRSRSNGLRRRRRGGSRLALAVPCLAVLGLFAGLADPLPAHAAGAPTTLTYTGPTWFETRRPALLSAVLTSAGQPVVGRQVSFIYDYPDGSRLPCSEITNATGEASCTIARVPGGGLPNLNVFAQFAGDSSYAGNAVFAGAGRYAYLAEGGFAVGDLNVSPISQASGRHVTFFSPSWRDANTLSGGFLAGAFHGFQTSDSEPKCGGSWKVYRENFDGPLPNSLPDHFIVAVTSKIKTSVVTDASGNQRINVQGDVVHVVVVQPDTEQPLDPSAGLAGTVAAVIC